MTKVAAGGSYPAFSSLKGDLAQNADWLMPYSEELWNRVLASRDGAVPERVAVAPLIPGDGATTALVGLAVYLTRGLGRTVLCVECDLRTPSYADLGLAPAEFSGLGGLMRGKAEFEKQICRIPLLDIHVMPAGPAVTSPSALMTPGRLQSVLSRATTEFDVVLLDSPALNSGPEARHVIASAVATVPVLRSGRAVPDKAAYWLGKIQEFGGRVGAVCLNAVPSPLPTRMRRWVSS